MFRSTVGLPPASRWLLTISHGETRPSTLVIASLPLTVHLESNSADYHLPNDIKFKLIIDSLTHGQFNNKIEASFKPTCNFQIDWKCTVFVACKHLDSTAEVNLLSHCREMTPNHMHHPRNRVLTACAWVVNWKIFKQTPNLKINVMGSRYK